MRALENKIIVISGASSGIGRSCALACGRQGAQLALIGRRKDELLKTAKLTGGKSHIYCQDLTDYDQIPALVQSIVKDMGKISGFIHSAGIETVLPLKITTHKHFESAFAINVISAFEIAREIARVKNMSEQGASLLFISSVMGVVGQPTKTVYSATKGALIAGAKSLALELTRKNVRVDCVSSGMVNTGMSQSLLDKVSPEAMDAIIRDHPLGIGEDIDIANICTFLLSDSAKWITGANYVVDGGYTAS